MNYKLRFFIPLAFAITALSGLIYLTGQQNLRQNANDPQIQTSEDIATRLKLNPTIPRSTANQIDMSQSLTPFVIIFDDKGTPLFSTGSLDKKVPVPLVGVFDYTRKHNQDRITWQPKSEVRIASIITRYSGKSAGFVLVGRSLREVEERVEKLGKLVALAWIVTMIGTFLACYIFIQEPKKLSAVKSRSVRKKS